MSEQRCRGPKKNKSVRQQAALERLEERKARTTAQQLQRLDAMFGVGKGAKKERARLMDRLAVELEEKHSEPEGGCDQ